MVALQSQPHICGMDPGAPTSRVPGKHCDDHNNTHHTIGPQASKATRTVHDTSLSPVLPTLSSRTTDINTYRCSHNNIGLTPSRQNHLPGIQHLLDPPVNSITVYIAGPSVSKAQTPSTPPSRADTPTPHPAFLLPGHSLIERWLQGEEEGQLVQLLPSNPRNSYPDPWNSELANKVPLSVRWAALADRLDSLEPFLDIPVSIHLAQKTIEQ